MKAPTSLDAWRVRSGEKHLEHVGTETYCCSFGAMKKQL